MATGGGDKIQIVLQAQDEVTDAIKTTRANIRAFKKEMTELSKDLDKPGNSERFEALRKQLVAAKQDLISLGRQTSTLKAQIDHATDPTPVDVLNRSAVQLTRNFGIASGASRKLGGTMAVLQRYAWRFRQSWDAALVSVRRHVEGLTTALRSSGLLMWARRGALALGLMGGAATVMGLKTASSLEQSKIAFTQFLGSAKKAGDLMAWIKQVSLETPFEMEGLTQATQRMLAYGFTVEETKKHLLTIGDAAAGLGKGQEGIDRLSMALGQMNAKQKIQSEEMRQLTELGIPAWKMLAKSMHMSVAELQSMVSKPGGGNALFDAGGMDKLYAALDKQYGGLMKKQSKTLAGRFSNLKDTLNTELADFLKGVGITGGLKHLMKDITDRIHGVFTGMRLAAQKVRPVIEKVFTFIRDNKEAFIAGAAAIGVMTLAMGALAIATNATGIPALILGIAALVAGLVWAYKHVEWFRKGVQAVGRVAAAVWKWIQGAVKWFVDWFGTYAWPAIRLYLKLWWTYLSKVVWPVLRTVFKLIAGAVKILWAYISKVFWPAIRRAFRLIIGAGRGLWNGLKTAWDKITGAFRAAKDAITTILGHIKNGFKGLWSGLTDGLGAAIDTMKQWLSKIPGMSWLMDHLFTGGPVTVGRPTIVGELGPEMFVPRVGSPRMLGTHGPELTRFSTPGVVIPNHLLAAAPAASNVHVTVPDAGRWTGPAVQEMHVHGDPAAGIREAERMIAQRERVAAERRG